MRHDTNDRATPPSDWRPEPLRGAFPTWGDLLAMLGIFLGANVLVGGTAGLVRLALLGAEAPDAAQAGRMLFVTYLLSMGLALRGVLLYRRLRGGRARVARLSRRGLDPALLGWALLLVVALEVVLDPLTSRLPGPPYEAMGRGAWTFAALVVLAPFLEELLCRGAVLEALRSRRGDRAAWIGSSLFFGIMHLYPAQALGAFVIGLVLGYVCLVSGSLWGAVALHAANNALAYWLMTAGYAETSCAEAVGHRALYVVLYAAALGAAVAAVRGLRRAGRRLRAAADKNREAA